MTYKCEDCTGGRDCDCPPMIDTGKFSSLKPVSWPVSWGANRYEQDPKDEEKRWRIAPGMMVESVHWPADEINQPTIWQHIWDYAVGFLAALGAMGLALGIGLYLGGYFEFLIKELSK